MPSSWPPGGGVLRQGHGSSPRGHLPCGVKAIKTRLARRWAEPKKRSIAEPPVRQLGGLTVLRRDGTARYQRRQERSVRTPLRKAPMPHPAEVEIRDAASNLTACPSPAARILGCPATARRSDRPSTIQARGSTG